MNCIDLKGHFGKQYKVGVEESADHPSYNTDLWYWEILCRIGQKKWKSVIYPYGSEYLAVMVTSMIIANRMREWPELEVIQDADDAVVFKFHADHLCKVVKAVGARTRRKLSPEHKRKLAESSKAFRFEKFPTLVTPELQPATQRSSADPSLPLSGDSEGTK